MNGPRLFFRPLHSDVHCTVCFSHNWGIDKVSMLITLLHLATENMMNQARFELTSLARDTQKFSDNRRTRRARVVAQLSWLPRLNFILVLIVFLALLLSLKHLGCRIRPTRCLLQTSRVEIERKIPFCQSTCVHAYHFRLLIDERMKWLSLNLFCSNWFSDLMLLMRLIKVLMKSWVILLKYKLLIWSIMREATLVSSPPVLSKQGRKAEGMFQLCFKERKKRMFLLCVTEWKGMFWVCDFFSGANVCFVRIW